MPAWNPAYPAVIGNQWLPSVRRSFQIAQGQPSPVARVRSLAAENINALRLGFQGNSKTTARAFVLIEIYEEGDELAQDLSYAEHPPVLDETIGTWTTNAGGTTNLFSRIDETVVYPPSSSDYIRQLVAGASTYRCSVDSSGFPSGARVFRVSVECVIGMVTAGGSAFVEVGLYYEPTADVLTPPGGIIYTNGLIPNQVNIVDCGEINPITLLPWTPADIQSFDSGNWHIRFNSPNGTGSNGPVVHSAALRVSYLPVENRVAVATWRRPAGLPAPPITTDALVPMPAGTGAWAKANATNYLYVPRIARDRLVGGSAPVANDIVWLAAQQDLGASGNPVGLSYAPPAGPPAMSVLTTDDHGQVTAPFTGDLVAVPRIVLRTTAPADSADSLAYLRDSSSTVLRPLTSSQQVGQRITTSTGPRSYLGVRCLVAPPDTADGTLTIRVLRVSDSVQFGGTFTITADEVRALPAITGTDARYVQGFLSSAATLASGVQYEIQMLVDAGDWIAIVPSAVGAGGQSFGGTTDFARLGTIAGGSSLTEQDLTIMLLEQPAAPATNVATVQTVTLDPDPCCCSVVEYDRVQVDWAATALGGSFSRYEIEREIDGGNGWELVWTITAEATSVWTDYEMPMDRLVRYRVRVVTTASAFSDWTVSGQVTPVHRKFEVVFTSNHDPTLEVAYEREPDVDFVFLDHQGDELTKIYGADYQVAFFDPNDRGVTEAFNLVVNFKRQPVDGSARPINMRDVFVPLRAIIRAAGQTIPYVCVRHRDGATTYAAVTMGTGRQTQPGNRWHVPIVVTPVTGVPVPGTSA